MRLPISPCAGTAAWLAVCGLVVGLGSPLHAALTAEQQIASAVLAAPADRRDASTVLGYDESGKLVELRHGSNDLICLAAAPEAKSFSVACYHRALEPYMRRGRELRAAGVTDAEANHRQRWQEAKEGKLEMPSEPSTLYVLSGTGYDPATGVVADAYLRFVVYIPGATAESTGLPTQPLAPGAPWLMYPGTSGAHIMISPPPPEKPDSH